MSLRPGLSVAALLALLASCAGKTQSPTCKVVDVTPTGSDLATEDCTSPPPSPACSPLGAPAQKASECCSGISGAVAGQEGLVCTCVAADATCATNAQCCSGSCVQGRCGCAGAGMACSGSSDCCYGTCVTSSSTDPPSAVCVPPGNGSCTTASECTPDQQCVAGMCCLGTDAAPGDESAPCCAGLSLRSPGPYDPPPDQSWCCETGLNPCSTNAECCSTECRRGVCTCDTSGTGCVDGKSCCSGTCTNGECQ